MNRKTLITQITMPYKQRLLIGIQRKCHVCNSNVGVVQRITGETITHHLVLHTRYITDCTGSHNPVLIEAKDLAKIININK